MIKKITRKIHLVLWAHLFFNFNVEVAVSQNVMGARHLAMGQTGVAVPGTSWSVFSNTALMPAETNGVSFYAFRYLGFAEITDLSAAVHLRTGWGTIGIGATRYGFDLFNENRFILAYKNSLERFHYGGSVSYTHVFQGGNYGSAGAIGFDLGLAAEVIDHLWFGARATNLNQPAYGDTDEELPRELAAGFSYKLASRALITAEIVKDVMFPISFRSGLEVEVFNSLFARGGITTEPTTYSFGFGYGTRTWEVNFGLQQHDPLGLSPAIDMGIRF